MAEAMIVTAVRDMWPDKRLENALASFKRQVGSPPVTLVDYGSGSIAAGGIRGLCGACGVKYVGLRVKPTRPNGNWSAGVAYNVGIRESGDDFILSVCPDTIMGPGLLGAVLGAFRDDPDVLVTSRRYEMYQGDEELVVDGVVPDIYKYELSKFDQNVIGMSREKWHAIRGFDERYVGSTEVDNDLVARALAAGAHKKQVGKCYHQFHLGGSCQPYAGPPNKPDPPSKGNPKTWGTVNRTINQGVYGRTRIEAI